MAQKNRIHVIGLFNYQPTCFSQSMAAAILLVVLLVSNRAVAENMGAVLQQAVAAHMIGVVPGHQKEKLFPKEDVTKKVFDDHSADFVKRFGTFVQWDGAAKDLAETKSPVHLIRLTCVTETIDPKTGKAIQWTRFRANVHLDNREEQKILNFRPLYEDGHIMNATGVTLTLQTVGSAMVAVLRR